MDKIILPKGQLIHVEGIPFELESPTVVLGNKANLPLLAAAPEARVAEEPHAAAE